ncbi:hypothetical protein H072_118 [Dactylellina haptotyla CBS 200.50]|uniref:glycerophosphodiester phosphodiesterase n=1 Tax=Dactylellina haptotyla (strain CBS 200.50) TaxID=1284197 RepID=S8CDV3_DACHA|nr:hypothetical protein H072_118 [Dactylellina haptotyla CBS 200.50]
MKYSFTTVALTAAIMAESALGAPAQLVERTTNRDYKVSLDPRPFYLVNNMTDSHLKSSLLRCQNGPFTITDFSIGHRGGATLQIPEESVENTVAGARMGAGVLECDVAFTKDRELVCRHSQCDLHTTTDILLRPELAAKCTVPFTPASGRTPASALCCTSDITLKEYMSLCSKMDASNTKAANPLEFQGAPPSFRTQLYETCSKVMSLESYIELVDSLPGNRKFTPELKTPPPQVPMPFQTTKGLYTQQQFARDMIETFVKKDIDPARVWPQSFLPDDIYQWIKDYPKTFGQQAVFLDESGDLPSSNVSYAAAQLPGIRKKGVNVIAPPINYLLAIDPKTQKVVPSEYAKIAREEGFIIIPWTFERSGPLGTVKARGEYYYSSIADVMKFDGQVYEVLDVLVKKVKIAALFSDWSSTLTYYANCFDLKGVKILKQKKWGKGGKRYGTDE